MVSEPRPLTKKCNGNTFFCCIFHLSFNGILLQFCQVGDGSVGEAELCKQCLANIKLQTLPHRICTAPYTAWCSTASIHSTTCHDSHCLFVRGDACATDHGVVLHVQQCHVWLGSSPISLTSAATSSAEVHISVTRTPRWRSRFRPRLWLHAAPCECSETSASDGAVRVPFDGVDPASVQEPSDSRRRYFQRPCVVLGKADCLLSHSLLPVSELRGGHCRGGRTPPNLPPQRGKHCSCSTPICFAALVAAHAVA